MTSFHEFGLAEPITRALADDGYATPTPIQSQTIPIALSGRDVVGIAQTGTGKTAAFALPILHRLMLNRHRPQPKSCRVLVLSPTRELSSQILDSFLRYGRNLKIAATLAIGGVPIGRQVRAMHPGVDVLVATPGRLLDLVSNRAVTLSDVDFLVLDEADRMLDMGFILDIRKVIAMLPKERQTLFFSATMPNAIVKLADQMLRDPARVAVTPVSSTAERIAQRVIHVERGTKPALLADLLKSEPVDRALVFTRTKHGADKVVRALAKSGIAAEAIHGNKSQNHRERALGNFRNGNVRTLVATDIAARGIDVDGISHVFNFDLPNVPETYVHRIGRTARAGAEGIAISLCEADEKSYLRDIERLTGKKLAVEFHRVSPSSVTADAPDARDETDFAPRNQDKHRGGQPSPGGARNKRRRRVFRQAGDQATDRTGAPVSNHRAGGKTGGAQQRRDGSPQQARDGGPGIAGVAFMNSGRKSSPKKFPSHRSPR